MASLTPDQNTFLLTPHIASASNLKTSKRCPGSDEPKETDRTAEKTEIRFKRYFCSGSKIPDELMTEILIKCQEEDAYVEHLSKEVFNNDIVTNHKIKYQFQTNVLKNLISQLEKSCVSVPDSLFDRLGTLMGMKEEEFVERLYMNENGNEVLVKFSESVNQLSMGTTGLSVWQASCDLANLFRLIPSSEFTRVLELGSGCGVSGISIAKMHGCEVVLTDYDDNVLEVLRTNAIKNGLMDESEDNVSKNRSNVRCLDWCDFKIADWKQSADLIIAADVVYDTALLASLCNVLSLLLRNAKAAIVACTRRNPASLSCFEHHLRNAGLEVVEMIEYENGEFRIRENSIFAHPTIFPFFSSLKTPTIFYNIQSK